MCYNDFIIKINLFEDKRFKDGSCTYKNTGSSHLNKTETKLICILSMLYSK